MSITLIILAFVAVLYLLFPSRLGKVYDGQAQVISLYNNELAELEKSYQQQQISEEEFNTLKAELDKKSSLAMLQTKKTTFSYRPSLLLPAVIFGVFLACSVFYYMKFYRGDVANWDGFKMAERGAIIEGLFNHDLANPYIEKKQFTICFAMQQVALEKYPNNPKVLASLSSCYLKSGYVQLAEMAASRGLTHQQNDADLNYYYAQSRLMQTGQSDNEIIAALSKTLKTNPNHQGALWLMGLITYQRGEYEEANFFFTRLQAIGVDNPELDTLLAEIKKQSDEAVAEQNQVVIDAQTDTELSTETVENTTEEAVEATTETITEAITFNISIDIDPLLTDSVNNNAELFVIVKSPTDKLLLAGKYALRQFPMTLQLSDNAEGIMKMGDIADENAVSVSARVSQQATAMPNTGDLESVPMLVSTNQNPIAVTLLINKVVQ